MSYRLNITKNADELLDHLVYYLIYCLIRREQEFPHLIGGGMSCGKHGVCLLLLSGSSIIYM